MNIGGGGGFHCGKFPHTSLAYNPVPHVLLRKKWISQGIITKQLQETPVGQIIEVFRK
jgi:hypothetical protein